MTNSRVADTEGATTCKGQGRRENGTEGDGGEDGRREKGVLEGKTEEETEEKRQSLLFTQKASG